VIAYRKVSDRDSEGTLARGVQQFQVGKRASATSLEWDNRLNHPSTIFVNELPASRALAALLLPEPFWEAASLQPLQHSLASTLSEVGVPSRIEWVGVRFDSDMADNPSVWGWNPIGSVVGSNPYRQLFGMSAATLRHYVIRAARSLTVQPGTRFTVRVAGQEIGQVQMLGDRRLKGLLPLMKAVGVERGQTYIAEFDVPNLTITLERAARSA
jgi:hypothetical protein